MTTRKKIVLALMIPVLVGALLFAFWPKINGLFLAHEQGEEIQRFYERNQTVQQLDLTDEPITTPTTEPSPTAKPFPELYQAMVEYNERIYDEDQETFGDAWEYKGSDFDLAEYGLDTEVVGVVDIPSLKISMPLYLGASYDHMAAGCTQVAGSSMPIGGINTNCVIAGHCGWGGAPYFRYLSHIEVGAYVYVTNLWETITYKVVERRIIYPNDLEQLLIQDGKDMISLFTCHPYASGGKFRFVAFCERVYE